MDSATLEMILNEHDDDLNFSSSNSNILGSLQFDKKVKSRSYRSQFTLNDEILVAVERREEFHPIKNQVIIEVDISLGICSSEHSKDNHYIVRLNDMASENAWVFRMINYDTFQDKDISNSIRDEAMEPNKLYLLQRKLKTKTEDSLSFDESTNDKDLKKHKLKSTISQYNPHPVFFNETNTVLRNELFINTGSPQYESIDDKTYTSCMNIDLSKTNLVSNDFSSRTKIDLHREHEISIPVSKNRKVEQETLPKKAENETYDRPSRINSVPVTNEENIEYFCTKSECSRKDEIIPFAEETDDEQSTRVNKQSTLSTYLQYYLPTEKAKEGDNDEHSEVSTCLESSTETESVSGYLAQTLMSETPGTNIACFDEFNSLSLDEDAESEQGAYDEVDKMVATTDSMEKRQAPYCICDDSFDLDELIYQEDMVLQVEESSPSISLNVTPIIKEWASPVKGKVLARKAKSQNPSSNRNENDEYVQVSARRMHFEKISRQSASLGISNDDQTMKLRLITSNNYADIVERERMIKQETLASENKENELDKESSVSFSSGSMIVKEVLSDENLEFFIKHNNLDIAGDGEHVDRDSSLDQVAEDDDEYEGSECSCQKHSSRKTPENSEDQSGSLLSEEEIDATSASSFTTSRNIDSIALKNLTKTPIECGTGRFEQFLEERERRMSAAPTSSFPVSCETQSSVSLSYPHSSQDFNQISNDQLDEEENLKSVIAEDRNSPLTSVSRTSSASSSVFNTSSELPDEGIFDGTNTVIRKEEKCSEIKRPSIVSTISISSVTNDTADDRREPPKIKDNIKESKAPIRDLSSSDWSSSSKENDPDLKTPIPKITPTVQLSESAPKKEIPLQLSLQRFDRFLEEKSKKENNSSGTEDTSSSSSDYRKPPSNNLILRHGDSIEDIEELLMQKTPNFDSHRAVSIRKQISLPNNNWKPDSIHTKDLSTNQIDATDHPIKSMSLDLQRKSSDTRQSGSAILISSSSSSSSSSSGESNPENENTELKFNSTRKSPVEGLKHAQPYKERDKSSSSSETESTSSDEEPPNQKRESREDSNINIRSLGKGNSVIEPIARHSSSSGSSESSSSDEEYWNTKYQSKDREESIEKSKDSSKVERPTKPGYSEPPRSQDSLSTSHSSYSSADEADNINFNNVDRTEKFSNSQRTNSIQVPKKPLSEHSSTSSCTLSSSSDEESNLVKTSSIDNFEKLEVLTGDTQHLCRERPGSITTSDKTPKSPINIDLNDFPDEVFAANHHSSSSCTLSSSSDEESIGNVRPITKQLSSNLCKVPDSMKADIQNGLSMDHREKFDNGKRPGSMEYQRKMKNSSSSSSCTLSSSSEEESKQSKRKSKDQANQSIVPEKANTVESERENNSKKSFTDAVDFKSIDHREKFEVPKKTNTIERQKKTISTNEQIEYHSSSEDDSLSSSSDEETEPSNPVPDINTEIRNLPKRITLLDCQSMPQNNTEGVQKKSSISGGSKEPVDSSKASHKSIDHRERFIDPRKANTIEGQRRADRVQEPAPGRSHSDSDTSFSSDEEPAKYRSIDRREKFATPKECQKILPFISSDKNPSPIQYKSIDRLEKFENSNPTSTIERKKQKDQINGKEPRYSSSDKSSSEEESCHVSNKSVDHKELFKGPNTTSHLQRSKKMENVNEPSPINSSSSDHRASKNSDKQIDPRKIKSIDHREKFGFTKGNHSVELKGKDNITRTGGENSITNLDGLPSSADEAWNQYQTSKSTDHREKLEDQKETARFKWQRKTKKVEEPTTLNGLDREGNKTSADHREKILSQRTDRIVNQQRNSSNFRNVTSKQSSSSSFTKSCSDKETAKEQCLSPEYVNVNPRMINGESGRPLPMSSSELSYSTTSEDSFTFKTDKDEKEHKDLRRYQTLPSKLPQSQIPIKERSKSLDKRIEIDTNSMSNHTSNRGSTVDMVEKKYHEYTERWSRHSPIAATNGKPKSRQTKVEPQPNKVPPQRSMGPFTTKPRPVPSYMSPVNAYPYEGSGEEYDSNDSIVSEYSVDGGPKEVSTRNSSLQDFVRDLSSGRLLKTPPPPPPNKSMTPKLTLKPKIAPRTVDLNYGAEEDKVDYSRPGRDRRTSANSVTTDSSYLDGPTLAKPRVTKPNLAKLDSLTSSSSMSSAPREVGKINRNNSTPNVRPSVSVSSTSTSTCTGDSDSEISPPQAPLSRAPSLQTPLKTSQAMSSNQIYRERSQMINGSNIYPVKSNDNIRRRIPSSSESSEYSSTSDEESSSKEFLETALD